MASAEDDGPIEETAELVRGVGVILMSIDSRVASIVESLGGEDGEEEDES